MAFMDWDGSLELGDAMIDRQHRRLVELINDVHDVCASPERADEIMRCITDMFLYAKEHFFDEEGLMERLCYPERESHSALHRAFVDKARALADECLADTMRAEDLLDYLVDWLRRHIALEDAQIVRHAQCVAK
jgi:hemerythrin-like metal-binding protein